MATGQEVVDWVASNKGKFEYSQTGDRLHPETSGLTDCSGLVAAAYRIVAGLDIGTYTDNMVDKGRSVFDTSENSVEKVQSLLQPGDLVFFQWNGHSGGPYWDHVEIYAGNGTLWSHGGDPLYGPVQTLLRNEWNNSNLVVARRFLGDDISVPKAEESPAPAPAPAPARAVPSVNFPNWGIPGDQYYGDINGPNESHGGYYEAEQPAVKAIQQWLIANGFVPNIGDINNGWADGLFEQETVDAVSRFQHDRLAGSTEFYGQVWHDDWDYMVSHNG